MKIVAMVLLLAVSSLAMAVTPADFEAVVNTDVSTASLFQLVQAQAYDQIDVERYFLLEGTVASTTILDPNPETYQALVELVTGEWEGLESIEVSRVYVYLVGPEFADRVPARVPRDPGPEVIQNNQALLVVGSFFGLYNAPDGTELPVVQGILVRN